MEGHFFLNQRKKWPKESSPPPTPHSARRWAGALSDLARPRTEQRLPQHPPVAAVPRHLVRGSLVGTRRMCESKRNTDTQEIILYTESLECSIWLQIAYIMSVVRQEGAGVSGVRGNRTRFPRPLTKKNKLPIAATNPRGEFQTHFVHGCTQRKCWLYFPPWFYAQKALSF
jgi:hypothetical protein